MAHAVPDRWLTPHRNCGSAAQEYSSVMANMVAAYYGSAYDSSDVVDTLEIALTEDY